MTSKLSRAERNAAIGKVVRVSSGNFLEMYDFIVYGYYAAFIASTFFPAGSEFVSLMLSLSTFGAGYLMRPIGALVLGTYIDRKGRRQGLILTLTLMAIGTLSIAVTPGYSRLGLLAPLIVLLGRLLQGISAGVEVGGVSVYLSEIATPAHRGFYCAFQSVSQQVAVIFTALVGIAITANISTNQMAAWGWRLPLLLGCLIIPLVMWLRRSLEETEVFRKGSPPRSTSEAFRIVLENWPTVIVGMMLSVLNTTAFYLITAYTPTFGTRALHLGATGTFVVTLCTAFSSLFWIIVGGMLSDRVGRRPSLLVTPVVFVLTAYPAMSWLVIAPTLPKLLAVELWYSFLFGIYNGAMTPALVEMMPQKIRTAAYSLAFSLATAIFGGFTPAIATYLIRFTGNRAAPALWMSLAAGVSLVGVMLTKKIAGTIDVPAAVPALESESVS